MYKVIVDGIEEGYSDSFGDAADFARTFKTGTVVIIDDKGNVYNIR